jgi:NAD(P)-dependent dehydrogenase (short-subunit alcohol dehydrogenase family)
MDLSGRSAIITGANQGLGKAIAAHFLRAGASVVLSARNKDLLAAAQAELAPLAVAPGQAVLHFKSDISKSDDCGALADFAISHLSNVCILVNNAGIYGPMGLLDDVDWEKWVEAIQINLFGTALMCRALVPHFRKVRYGKIVNLSGGGATAPLPRISSYAAGKAAVVRLTETLALEVKEDRIDVNAIAPGALNTRLLDEVIAAGPDQVGAAFYEKSLKQRDEGGTSLDRGAELAVFLASAKSDGITGRLLSAVWDDWSNLPERREQLSKSDIYTLRRIVPQERGLTW